MRTARKIKLCGSPTTEELKKKHSSRLAEGVEMCSPVREDQVGEAAAGGPGSPTFTCG